MLVHLIDRESIASFSHLAGLIFLFLYLQADTLQCYGHSSTAISCARPQTLVAERRAAEMILILSMMRGVAAGACAAVTHNFAATFLHSALTPLILVQCQLVLVVPGSAEVPSMGGLPGHYDL